MVKEVYDYIIAEKVSYESVRVPITNSKDWNMKEHIERCTNVANGWFHGGDNDGNRPYKDIVTPIKNVALRTEGFDVKDIVPFVNDAKNYHLSFFIKKFHPQWARKNEIDTFIDELVESSVVYDLALVKNVNNARPEVVPLQQIAFCDQTDIMSGAICLKHQYSVSQLLEFKGKWNADKIDEAILMAEAEKKVSQAGDKPVKTPSKYIEVYELHGEFPETWMGDGDEEKYTKQMHIVCFYTSEDGNKNGITLYEGKDKELTDTFRALVIDKVFGRACGRSLIETLFDPQVWTNYSEIKIKKMLDAASVILLQTSSDELGDRKIDNLKNNEILKHEDGKPITQVQLSPINLPAFTNKQKDLEQDAKIAGSASDAQLGKNPTSGTPFALENLIVQQGQGIHEYRQGKIATFVSDQLYKDWILKFIVKEMDNGKEFSEELTLDEMQDVSERIAKNRARGDPELIEKYKAEFMKDGSRKFFKVLKGELKKLPVEVYVNIKGKQKYMAQDVDKITNIIRAVMANPQAFSQIPGIGKMFNEMIELSGLDPIDFNTMLTPQQPQQQPQQVEQVNQTK